MVHKIRGTTGEVDRELLDVYLGDAGVEVHAHLYPLLRVSDSLVTQVLESDESLNTVIQSCLNTHCLTRTLPGIKVIPHLYNMSAME